MSWEDELNLPVPHLLIRKEWADGCQGIPIAPDMRRTLERRSTSAGHAAGLTHRVITAVASSIKAATTRTPRMDCTS